MMDTRRRNLAITLIIIGVIFLLVQMNVFSGIGSIIGDLGRGFGEFFGSLGRGVGEVFGSLGRMIGQFFGSLPWSSIGRLWPLALILVGLGMIFRRSSASREKTKRDQHEI
ncbi:MAG TPA: hypothetical protein VK003_04290 [Oceanobacillus sp.]|nr:hypothetical protein [Oceanobacillus sp.]